jgi:hypothetical protein
VGHYYDTSENDITITDLCESSSGTESVSRCSEEGNRSIPSTRSSTPSTSNFSIQNPIFKACAYRLTQGHSTSCSRSCYSPSLPHSPRALDQNASNIFDLQKSHQQDLPILSDTSSKLLVRTAKTTPGNLAITCVRGCVKFTPGTCHR